MSSGLPAREAPIEAVQYSPRRFQGISALLSSVFGRVSGVAGVLRAQRVSPGARGPDDGGFRVEGLVLRRHGLRAPAVEPDPEPRTRAGRAINDTTWTAGNKRISRAGMVQREAAHQEFNTE